MVASPKILFCYLPLCVRIVQDKFQTAMSIFGILVIFYFSLHNFTRAIYQNVQKLIFEVGGTFWQLFNIAHHFQHIFSNKKTLTRSWPPGGAWYPPLPTRLMGVSVFSDFEGFQEMANIMKRRQTLVCFSQFWRISKNEEN